MALVKNSPIKFANQKALAELAKSTLRGIWFGILGVVSTALLGLATNGFGDTVGVTLMGQYVDIALFLAFVFGLMAKGIDRYIHTNKQIEAKGIAPGFLQR